MRKQHFCLNRKEHTLKPFCFVLSLGYGAGALKKDIRPQSATYVRSQLQYLTDSIGCLICFPTFNDYLVMFENCGTVHVTNIHCNVIFLNPHILKSIFIG